MVTMGFHLDDGEAGYVSEVCWKSNHRTNQDDSCRSDYTEADLPTAATRATQLSTIAMEKYLRMPDTNPKKQTATAEVRQRLKKTRWRNIASEVW